MNEAVECKFDIQGIAECTVVYERFGEDVYWVNIYVTAGEWLEESHYGSETGYRIFEHCSFLREISSSESGNLAGIACDNGGMGAVR